MRFCIINGRLVPAENAAVSIQDRGFRYGDGVFETLSVQDGVPYQFDWHVKRLADGLAAIKIHFDIKMLPEHVRLLLQKNAVEDGLLRLQVTRGIGSRGYLPDPSHKNAGPTWIIETLPKPDIEDKPVALWRSGQAKISPRALPVRYKLCQGLHSTLARIEAAEHACADALLLNEAGQLCETSSGNIFWRKEATLFTPALSCGILEGATRAAAMRLSPLPVREVEAGLAALADADAVFITNSVWPVIAVNRLLPDGTGWDSGGVAGEFRRRIAEDRAAYSRTHRAKWQDV